MPFGSIFRSILNLRRWRGLQPNALINGRVDVRVGAAANGLFGAIKLVQSGYSSLSVQRDTTATITIPTAVVVAKSVVLIQPSLVGTNTNVTWGVELTGTTTITITSTYSSTSSGSSDSFRVGWQVVESY